MSINAPIGSGDFELKFTVSLSCSVSHGMAEYMYFYFIQVRVVSKEVDHRGSVKCMYFARYKSHLISKLDPV